MAHGQNNTATTWINWFLTFLDTVDSDENRIFVPVTVLFSCHGCLEGGGAACPVASYILHNSLAYGADWSRLSLEKSAPCSPVAAEPNESLTESRGHLRIQYESPTASFDTSLEDDAGGYIPESTAVCSTPHTAAPAVEPEGEAPSLSCLLASCSFYDHMLHVWRWDWTPDDPQESQHCWSTWSFIPEIIETSNYETYRSKAESTDTIQSSSQRLKSLSKEYAICKTLYFHNIFYKLIFKQIVYNPYIVRCVTTTLCTAAFWDDTKIACLNASAQCPRRLSSQVWKFYQGLGLMRTVRHQRCY